MPRTRNTTGWLLVASSLLSLASGGVELAKEQYIDLILQQQGAAGSSTDQQQALAVLRSQLMKLPAAELYTRAVAAGAIDGGGGGDGSGGWDHRYDEWRGHIAASLPAFSAAPQLLQLCRERLENLSADKVRLAGREILELAEARGREVAAGLHKDWGELRPDMQMLLAATLATVAAHALVACWRACGHRQAARRAWNSPHVVLGSGGDGSAAAGLDNSLGSAGWAEDMAQVLLQADDDEGAPACAPAPEPEQQPQGRSGDAQPPAEVDSPSEDDDGEDEGVKDAEGGGGGGRGGTRQPHISGRPLMTALLGRRFLTGAQFAALGKAHTHAQLELLRQSDSFKAWWGERQQQDGEEGVGAEVDSGEGSAVNG
eukprot:COSAG05_NODE_553_length_8711_cov_165.199257_3_plen_372_part_00